MTAPIPKKIGRETLRRHECRRMTAEDEGSRRTPTPSFDTNFDVAFDAAVDAAFDADVGAAIDCLWLHSFVYPSTPPLALPFDNAFDAAVGAVRWTAVGPLTLPLLMLQTPPHAAIDGLWLHSFVYPSTPPLALPFDLTMPLTLPLALSDRLLLGR